MVRYFLRQRKVRITVEGHSHVFLYDGEHSDGSAEKLKSPENSWQWIFPAATCAALLQRLVDPGSAVSLPQPNEALPVIGEAAPQPQGSPDDRDDSAGGQDAQTPAPDPQLPTGDQAVPSGPAPNPAPSGEPAVDPIAPPPPDPTPNEAQKLYPWAAPHIAELLARLSQQYPPKQNTEDLRDQSDAIVSKLRKFLPINGIKGDFDEPQVTPNAFRLYLRGQMGVTPQRIMKLADELESVEGIKLLDCFVVPGFNVLSIQRPERSIVYYLELLQKREVSEPETQSNTQVLMGLSEEDGSLLYYPFHQSVSAHALLGGMTGSGKSQLLTTMIVDLMLTNHPDRLCLLLVDPKQVEFTPFENTPFVRVPEFLSDMPELQGSAVIRDSDLAIQVMNRLAEEMERRYQIFRNAGVNDIRAYFAALSAGKLDSLVPESLPRVLLIFDEVADWMLDGDFQKAIKTPFQRLAGKARAAGIHMLLSTQRPDNSVVPPILRANLGGKIALKVDRAANSKIILDEDGAERLLNNGNGIARLGVQPKKFQSAFLPTEVRDAVLHCLNETPHPNGL